MLLDPPIAHGPDHGLTDHLQAVAAIARRQAPARSASWAEVAGLWHDLGKFRPGFQRYVRTDAEAHIEGRGVGQRDKSHSAAGALHALAALEARFGDPGRRAGWVLAQLIVAHHAGLYDSQVLRERLQGSGAADSRREHDEAVLACSDHAPGLLAPPSEFDAAGLFAAIPGLQQREPLAQALWLRMLFSALVDADFLDTEAYMDRQRSRARPGFPSLHEYQARLDDHLETLARSVHAAGRSGEPVMQ
ncbi:MAG: CRISPR-associated endonuclease Cas3'', partial [Rubrivivax sp.]